MTTLGSALWITLIGMGLVFLSILMLWGLMALLVRLTAEKPPEIGAEEPEAGTESVAIPSGSLLLDQKRRAAAVAVAFALAREKSASSNGQPAVSVSPWQAVNRANQISQQINASRKKVVR